MYVLCWWKISCNKNEIYTPLALSRAFLTSLVGALIANINRELFAGAYLQLQPYVWRLHYLNKGTRFLCNLHHRHTCKILQYLYNWQQNDMDLLSIHWYLSENTDIDWLALIVLRKPLVLRLWNVFIFILFSLLAS